MEVGGEVLGGKRRSNRGKFGKVWMYIEWVRNITLCLRFVSIFQDTNEGLPVVT
jgi:hypothetical protein